MSRKSDIDSAESSGGSMSEIIKPIRNPEVAVTTPNKEKPKQVRNGTPPKRSKQRQIQHKLRSQQARLQSRRKQLAFVGGALALFSAIIAAGLLLILVFPSSSQGASPPTEHSPLQSTFAGAAALAFTCALASLLLSSAVVLGFYFCLFWAIPAFTLSLDLIAVALACSFWMGYGPAAAFSATLVMFGFVAGSCVALFPFSIMFYYQAVGRHIHLRLTRRAEGGSLEHRPVPETFAIHYASAGKGFHRRALLAVLLAVGEDPNLLAGDSATTPLTLAADSGNLIGVRTLLEASADINVEHLVTGPVLKGHEAVVKALLAAGAASSPEDEFGRTPLHFVAQHGHISMMKLLLSNGAFVNAMDVSGHTPLDLTNLHGHIAATKILLAAGANPNLTDGEGKTMLHVCSEKGEVEMVERLLASGADINMKDAMGRTSVFLAAENGRSQVVEMLLQGGADCTALGPNQISVLDVACQGGHNETLKALLQWGAYTDKHAQLGLSLALNSSDWPTVGLYHRAGLGREATKFWFFRATFAGVTDTVHGLLGDAGISPNMQDKEGGMTPLMVAAHQGHYPVVKALLQGGADVNVATSEGVTALWLAIFCGHLRLVELLLKEGAAVDIASEDGTMPLHVAAGGGQMQLASACAYAWKNEGQVRTNAWGYFKPAPEIVKALWRVGAGQVIDVVDKRGRAPLHVAIIQGCTDIALMLLQLGANPDVLDGRGSSPLHLATTMKNQGLIDALLYSGAMPLHLTESSGSSGGSVTSKNNPLLPKTPDKTMNRDLKRMSSTSKGEAKKSTLRRWKTFGL